MPVEMPKQLGKSPLLEAVFELRFEPAGPAVGDLLPGLLYSSLKAEYPQVMPLPMASIPREMREKRPELLYQASHRLTGGSNSVQVGDRVIALSSAAYPGWARFKDMVEFLIEAVNGTGLIKQVDRFSFKYVNIIEASQTEQQLSLLNARIELIGKLPSEKGFRLRVEREDSGCVTIIEIMTHTQAIVSSTSKEVSGLLITVDTLRPGIDRAFLTSPSGLLEEVHSVAKDTFYSLLTDATLKRLEPVC